MQRILPLFVLGALLCPAFQTAQAQVSADPTLDPDAVFERCVSRIRQTVTRCRNANAETTQDCLRRIRVLLNAGHEERARAVARRCIEVIETRTQNCVRSIRETCRECIGVLVDLGANELARRLHNACENAVEHVVHNGRRSINAIKSAFD